LLDFRRVNSFTVSWPVVLLAALVLLVIGVLVAWGVRALERENRAEQLGERIQQEVGEALAREPSLAGSAVLPVASLPLAGPPTLTLTGSVPSAAARERALAVAARELERLRPDIQVVDRLDEVRVADRRRA
jgi:hypothetical protein